MKKLTLDELKVDSYAVQVSENELTEVKGGTGWLCVDLGIALATLAIAAYNAFKHSTPAPSAPASGVPSGVIIQVNTINYIIVDNVTYAGMEELLCN